MNKKVYLAGGFKSGWQNKIKGEAPLFEYLDPSLHNIDDPNEYTAWDLNAVKDSEIIFAYMESSNPAGYALCLEVGFAKALGKTILFVEEHPSKSREKYFSMVRACSDKTFKDIELAIEYLKTLR